MNRLASHGRRALAELGRISQIESDLKENVESEFDKMIDRLVAPETARRHRRPGAEPAPDFIRGGSQLHATGG
ncbi:hypothetical protein FBR04_03760 [Betaproteobacteria bacterium PRO7]|nr:hypothetical protein [Burkholderiaceae bacterium]MDL1860132.1 hypothetical protein [Betaproteobacteria bacterium PRO7]